jgi:hypothetical protein
MNAVEGPQLLELQLAEQQLHERQQFAERCEFSATVPILLRKSN